MFLNSFLPRTLEMVPRRGTILVLKTSPFQDIKKNYYGTRILGCELY